MTTPDTRQMISQLIATPSISCVQPELDMSNQGVIDLLANWLQPLGFDIRIQALDEPGKANLIATLGQGSGGLILSGHTDTVPYDESRWRSDPFRLSEKDDRLYGLGSCDMKSFLALAIAASRRFDRDKLKHPLTLVATANEETTMSGARLLADNEQLLGRCCIIGEPTGLRPIRQHKGILMESIRFIGASGHSSNPELGNSALEAMHDFIARLLDYRRQLQKRFHNPAFEIPRPTLNLGHIHGGDNPNRICGQCELHIDIRFLPGMSLRQLREDIAGLAQEVARQRQLSAECESLFHGVAAMDTAADSGLARYIESITRLRPGSVAFGTEAPYYNDMGCQTIVIGPGAIDQAHQPDEFLPVAQIEPTIQLLQNLIQHYCMSQ